MDNYVSSYNMQTELATVENHLNENLLSINDVELLENDLTAAIKERRTTSYSVDKITQFRNFSLSLRTGNFCPFYI